MSRHFQLLLALAFLWKSTASLWSQDASVVLGQEVAEAMQRSQYGQRGASAELLSALAAEAEKENALEPWAWAEAATVAAWLDGQKESEDFTLEGDLDGLLTQIVRRCEAKGATGPLSYVWFVRARYAFEQEKHPVAAAQAAERAGAYAMDSKQVNQAISHWLYAARIYRNEGQLARLREADTWLQMVAKAHQTELTEETQRQLASFRKLSQPILEATFPDLARSEVGPELNLQPAESSVVVSKVDAERGRARFIISNHQTRSVEGWLTLTASQGEVRNWERQSDKLHIQLGTTLKPGAAQHRVRLLPGEKLKVYVEYFFNEATSSFSDQVQLDWTDDSSSQVATGKFTTAAGQSAFAQVTNESKVLQTSTWPVPFYHEIFYRAKESGMAVEKFMVRTGAPARVEIYNEDNGELLAVDAEGDGIYEGKNDLLSKDLDRVRDGQPDVVVSQKYPVASLEIYVFPLVHNDKGTPVSIHMVDDVESRWRQDAVDQQHTK